MPHPFFHCVLTKPCLSWDYKLPFSPTPLIRPPGHYSIASPPEFCRVNCSEVILKLSITFAHTRRGGGGGRCHQGNLWYSPPASMASRLPSVTFKLASKVFIEETDQNFDFIAAILFRFLEFGDFKVSIVIENST